LAHHNLRTIYQRNFFVFGYRLNGIDPFPDCIGIDAYLDGQLQTALAEWEGTLKAFPNNKSVQEHIALVKDKIASQATHQEKVKRAETLFQLSLEDELNGRFADALIKIDRVITLSPGMARAVKLKLKIQEKFKSKKGRFLEAGRVALREGQLTGALSFFKAGLKEDPTNLELKNILEATQTQVDLFIEGTLAEYRIHMGERNFLQANSMLSRLKADYEENPKIKAEVEKHQKVIQKILEEDFATAEQLFKKGEFESAENLYKKLLRYNPDYVQAARRIRDISFEKQKLERRQALLKMNEEADKYLEAGFEEKALSLWEEILKIDPSLIDISQKANQLQKKIELKRKKEKFNKMFQQGLALYKKGGIGAALRVWRKVLKLDPTHPEARTFLDKIKLKIKELENRGIALEEKKKWRSAAKAWKKVLRLDPTHSLAKKSLNRVRQLLRAQTAKKLAARKKALAAAQKNVSGGLSQQAIEKLLKTGLNYYRKENYTLALAEWQKVSKADPENKRASRYLANLKAKMERLKNL